MYGAMYFAMALGMSSAATTRSSKRNTMVAVVSWRKEEKQKTKVRNEGHKVKLTAQCNRGTSKKETMGDVSTFNFSLFLLNCSMV